MEVAYHFIRSIIILIKHKIATEIAVLPTGLTVLLSFVTNYTLTRKF